MKWVKGNTKKHQIERFNINHSHPDRGQREKINLNFYFKLLCGASKSFMKALKVFIIKPFEAPQRKKKCENENLG